MTLIHVPRPPKSSYHPTRPVSALLKAQIEYLHHAERRLPLRYRSEIYVNAIKTEGEAACYIREVTEAIHNAYGDAAAKRVAPKRKRVIKISAVADKRTRATKTHTAKKKKTKGMSRRRK
jgi:hypothetical protein